MPEEIITPAPATPATAEAPKPEVNNNAAQTNTGTVTKDSAPEKPKGDGLPKGVKTRIWEQAEEIRRLKAELEAAKTPKPDTPTDTQAPDLLDDPNKWAKIVQENAAKNAQKNVMESLAQAREAERKQKDYEEGLKYLTSQPELTDDDAQLEVAEILKREDIAYIADRFPSKAAKIAFEEWKVSKGLTTAKKEAAAANVATTTTKTTAASSEKKIWTKDEISKYLSDYKSSDFEARKAEIFKAKKEGRIKI